MQNQDTISSLTNWFNPFISPNGKQIEQIMFYDETGEVFTCASAWFGDNNKFKHVVFPEKINNRRKGDFSRNEFFTAPHPQKWSKGEVNTLFIPTKKVGFECLGERLKFENETSRNYLTHYKFTAFCEKKLDSEGLKEYTIEITGFYRIEKTELGKKCDEIADIMKSQDVKISGYDVERLLKVLDISIKP